MIVMGVLNGFDGVVDGVVGLNGFDGVVYRQLFSVRLLRMLLMAVRIALMITLHLFRLFFSMFMWFDVLGLMEVQFLAIRHAGRLQPPGMTESHQVSLFVFRFKL